MPTFYHGSKSRFYMEGRDVSAQFRSMRGAMNVGNADVSTWGEGWKKYLTGLQDATGTAEGIYDGAASRIDPYVEEILSASEPAVFTWVINGDQVGRRAWGMEGLISNYEVKAGMGDAATFTMEVKPQPSSSPAGGWEPGVVLWAGSRIAASTLGTGQNISGCSTYGGFFYVQILSTTASCRIALQHSGDNSTYTDLLTASYPQTASYMGGHRYTASGSVMSYVRVAACPGMDEAASLTYHAMFGRRYFPV